MLPEEYCGVLGDDFWFILVFSFAWSDSEDDFRMDAVFSSLLGSTVDTYACQSTEACGFSRTDLGSRGRFCHVPVALGQISHIFIVKVDTLLRSILVLFALWIHVHASVYDRFLEEFPIFSR